MPEFAPCTDKETLDALEYAVESYHPELKGAEVTIGLEFASPTSGKELERGVLMLHGYPCAAIASITPYRYRVRGCRDAIITIDLKKWEVLTTPQRDALLDHELHHFEVVRDDEGHIESDPCGRPKLTMRKHDIVIGGFRCIIDRHGKDAIEAMAAKAILKDNDKLRQMLLFADTPGDSLPASEPFRSTTTATFTNAAVSAIRNAMASAN